MATNPSDVNPDDVELMVVYQTSKYPGTWDLGSVTSESSLNYYVEYSDVLFPLFLKLIGTRSYDPSFLLPLQMQMP